MTTKEYLRQYRKLNEAVRQIEKEIDAIEAEIDSTASGGDSGHTSEIANRTERVALRLVEIRQRWYEAKERAWAKREEVENVILMASDPIYGRLLYDRYILFMDWGQITDDLHYTDESHVRGRLHSKALQSVERFINDDD